MPFTVVLDTCVIYPAHLRDTLLRLAERGLYRTLWSGDILDELHRNLLEDGLNANSVDRLLTEMRRAFPDAEIGGYQSLIEGLTCDPKDRHMLAAAVRADAAAIVTFNIRDFPAVSVDPFEIDVIDPDSASGSKLEHAEDVRVSTLRIDQDERVETLVDDRVVPVGPFSRRNP